MKLLLIVNYSTMSGKISQNGVENYSTMSGKKLNYFIRHVYV